MQTIRVRTTQNVFIEYPLASVGERIAAYLIDWIILVLYTVAIVAIFAKVEVKLWYVWLIVLGIPWLLFSLLFEIFMNGQTPGKLALKIKVVRLDGTPPAIGDYLMRWIFSFIDFYILSGALAVVVIAVGGKGQRLGDIVAGTSVVK
ncbi:MAG TPA: RDD family protein, partial [Chryseolinea sp.]|nr:RDD family protein [Chryseolinea sp.]